MEIDVGMVFERVSERAFCFVRVGYSLGLSEWKGLGKLVALAGVIDYISGSLILFVAQL